MHLQHSYCFSALISKYGFVACTQALNYNIFKVGAGAPEIKSQELLKLQMSSAQAEAKQLALMEVGIKSAIIMDCPCCAVSIN